MPRADLERSAEMSKRPSVFGDIGEALGLKVLGVFVMIGAAILALPLLWIAEKTKIEGFRVAGFLLVLIGGPAATFFLRGVVSRMNDDDSLTFSLAAAHTWYHWLMCLAFVPIIGPVAERIVGGRTHKNPFLAGATEADQPPPPTPTGRGELTTGVTLPVSASTKGFAATAAKGDKTEERSASSEMPRDEGAADLGAGTGGAP
jgi:hypothetical protein